MNYLRFVFCLSFGLFGITLFLMTVMDTLFVDWDVYADLKKWFRTLFFSDRRRYAGVAPQRAYAVRKSAYEQEFLGGVGRERHRNRKPQLALLSPDA